MTTTRYEWSEVPGETAGGVLRQVIEGGRASLRRVTIPAGTRGQRHSHGFEQFVCVLEGRARLETAEGTCTLEPGVVIRFAPDAWHAAEFETDTVLLEIDLPGT